MRKHTPGSLSLPVSCLLLVLGLSPVLAQDEAPDEAAMMQAMAAAGTPGEAHEMLAETVGTWNMEIKMWMGPGEPTVTTGTAERKMILGGRVLVEEVTSSMMGQTMNGFAMTGYDNVTGKYWSTWSDNMSTGLTTSHGTYDAATGVYTYEGEMPDAMSGGMTPYSAKVWSEDGKEIMEMYDTRGGGEAKMMEIVYSRQ